LKLTGKIDMKDYQKPELTYIDDSAFDEMGQGSSGFGVKPPKNDNGNHYGWNNGPHYGGGSGGGKNHK
jgi:hypothetical protein